LIRARKLSANKNELLLVLDRPEILLHTNGSQRDLREHVIKRKISGGTRSDADRDCRDAFLGLLLTCQKLGVSFWDYLGHRLGVLNAKAPDLPDPFTLTSAPPEYPDFCPCYRWREGTGRLPRVIVVADIGVGGSRDSQPARQFRVEAHYGIEAAFSSMCADYGGPDRGEKLFRPFASAPVPRTSFSEHRAMQYMGTWYAQYGLLLVKKLRKD
jgi:hypothetical protein